MEDEKKQALKLSERICPIATANRKEPDCD